jgi:hypothetical protein
VTSIVQPITIDREHKPKESDHGQGKQGSQKRSEETQAGQEQEIIGTTGLLRFVKIPPQA